MIASVRLDLSDEHFFYLYRLLWLFIFLDGFVRVSMLHLLFNLVKKEKQK